MQRDYEAKITRQSCKRESSGSQSFFFFRGKVECARARARAELPNRANGSTNQQSPQDAETDSKCPVESPAIRFAVEYRFGPRRI